MQTGYSGSVPGSQTTPSVAELELNLPENLEQSEVNLSMSHKENIHLHESICT